MIKPGETTQYLLEATTGVGTIRLEYTENHSVWKSAKDVIGTVLAPITSELGWIKNESPKDRVFRFRAVSIGATSTTWSCTLTKQLKPAFVFQDTVVTLIDNDAPVGGADGDGAQIAGAGSIYIDTSTGKHYRNEGTAAMTIWASM